MGDPAGVGPELCLHVLAYNGEEKHYTPVVFGNASILRKVAQHTGRHFNAEIVDAQKWDGTCAGNPMVVNCGVSDISGIEPGKVSAACGAASYEYIQNAVSAAQQGKVAGIVTAPIHKESLSLAGVPYPGHTEMLAALTGCRNFCMMMYAEEIKVCLVTTHLALSEAIAQISSERIINALRLGVNALRGAGNIGDVRVVVCGLNPHAGEHGFLVMRKAELLSRQYCRHVQPDTMLQVRCRRIPHLCPASGLKPICML